MNCCPPCALEDEMLTMRPHPSSIMTGTTAWQQLNVPVRFTSRRRCHFSGVIDRKESTACTPALLTSTVGGPNRSCTCATPASICWRSVTSTVTPSALPPEAATLPAAASAASASRSNTATAIPSAARRSLTASPIPDAPPVTMATRDAATSVSSLMGKRAYGRPRQPARPCQPPGLRSSGLPSVEPPRARARHQRQDRLTGRYNPRRASPRRIMWMPVGRTRPRQALCRGDP